MRYKPVTYSCNGFPLQFTKIQKICRWCSFSPLFFVIIVVRTNDSFDLMLHRYRGLLFTLCRRYQRRGATAEDLLQEASVALWMNREMLLALPVGPRQAALVWKIARNRIIDELRRSPMSEAMPEGYETAADDRSMVQELHERITLLPEPDRTVVRMRLEGYSYEEIADALGMTVKNVSVKLVRIKEKLRKEWT